MKHYGIVNPEGSIIINPVVPSGTSDPTQPDTGELFFRTDSSRLQVYGGGSWDSLIPSTELSTLYGPLAADNSWAGINSFLQPVLINDPVLSILEIRATTAPSDSAFQGMITKRYDGTHRGFFGSVPGDVSGYAYIATWDDTGSPQGWNKIFAGYPNSNELKLGTGNDFYFNDILVAMAGSTNTFTAANTFSTSYAVTDQRFWDGVDSSGGIVIEQETSNSYSIAYNDDGVGSLFNSTLAAVKISFNSSNGFTISARPPAGSPTSVYTPVFYANHGSQLLALGANLQYGGDNVALESRANLFKVGQTLYHNNPSLNWFDTATVDQNFTAYVQSGVFNLRGMLDSFVTTAFTPLKVDYNADTLYIQSGDITFNGTSLLTGGLLSNLADVDLTGSPPPQVDDILYYADGSPPTWKFKTPIKNALLPYQYTATAGQTTFSGTDDKGITLVYTPGYLMVFRNGILLDPDDYTATDGTSIVLGAAASLNDTINIVGFGTFDVANTYTRTEADATFAPIARAKPNLIINGDFRVWQRGTSFAAAVGVYTADRWKQGGNHDGAITVQKTSTYLEVDVTTADTSIGAGQYCQMLYGIEGYDVEFLGWGTADAKDVTLSFKHAHTKTGTYCVKIGNAAANRSYIAEYTQGVADTWETSTITIPGCTDGTWEVTTSAGIYIVFTYAAGSNYQLPGSPQPTNSWEVGNYLASTNQVNALDSTSNYLRFDKVKLEEGSIATDFEPRPFSEELTLCQRYYQKSYEQGTAPGSVTANGAWNLAADRAALVQYISEPFLVMMRTTPTFAVYGTTGTSNEITGVDSASLTFSTFAATERGIQNVAATAAFTATDRYRLHWTANADY